MIVTPVVYTFLYTYLAPHTQSWLLILHTFTNVCIIIIIIIIIITTTTTTITI